MYGIWFEDCGVEVKLGMGGEFDASSLGCLKERLDGACASGRPVMVDLSGVTFLDVQSTRELVIRSMIQGPLLTFVNPSSGVLASARAIGVKGPPAQAARNLRSSRGPERRTRPNAT